MQIKIAPSIISADLTRLGECLAEVAATGVEWMHVDVADGHFVPNLMAGPDLTRATAAATNVPVDCHLMIEEPLRYVEAFVKAGARRIFIHPETVDDLSGAVDAIGALGVEVGLAFKPTEDASCAEPLVGRLNCLMAMTVEPGFSGQSFMEVGCEKIPHLRRAFGTDIDIYVDGGIGPKTAPIAAGYGANVMIAASAVFCADVPAAEAAERLRAAAEPGLRAYIEKGSTGKP
jgi:ribulose-phosphate 3-epimerase